MIIYLQCSLYVYSIMQKIVINYRNSPIPYLSHTMCLVKLWTFLFFVSF